MRKKRILQDAFGLDHPVVEVLDFDETTVALSVAVRPMAKFANRCGRCQRHSPRCDHAERRRRWRALEPGTTKVFLEAPAPRVRCRNHGVTVAAVPWARHGAGHTCDFDDQAAWLAVHVSKSAVVQPLRVAWRTVGAIAERVSSDIDRRVDRLEGLTRIGVDEISYKRGHRYLTIVVDHDSGRLASPRRVATRRHSTGSSMIWESNGRLNSPKSPVIWLPGLPEEAQSTPRHALCRPFPHCCLGPRRPRRRAWNTAKGRTRADATRRRPAASTGDLRQLKLARRALCKNSEHLGERQRSHLAWIEASDPKLWRAYLLNEGLRVALSLSGGEGGLALDDWINWARRSRLSAFVTLQRKVVDHREAIEAAMDTGLSNALVESTNTKISLLTRIAYGFHGPEPFIALAKLSLGGHCPLLPGQK